MHRILWLRTLRRWLVAPRPRTSGSALLRPRPFRVRPRLETLEDRTLLSVPPVFTVNLGGDFGTSAGLQTGPNSGDLRWCVNQADNPNNANSTIEFAGNIGG